jgi:hypothetical protein
MRISLGIATRGEVCIETTMALMHLLKETPHEFHLNFHKGTYLGDMRNAMLEEARAMKADYLFFVDTDVIFPPDGLNRLLARNKDIIGGMYNMKVIPPVNTIKMADENGKIIAVKDFDVPTKLFQCYAIPSGFMLIKLDAIKDLKKPFNFDYDQNGEFIGEDVGFCKRCHDIGLEIWCDPTINIGHIGSYVY